MAEQPSGCEETDDQRLDRNLGELLQERRVALPGVPVTFHLQQKQELVFLANRLAIAGLGFLALAMTGALMLITDILFGGIATVVVTAGAAAMFIGLWYVLPVRRRVSLGMRPFDQPDPGPGPAGRRQGGSPGS